MITNPEKIEHQLPHDVLAYVKKHFSDPVIIDMEVITRPNGNINYYKVDVVDGEDTHYLRFDKKGRLLNDEAEFAAEDKVEEQEMHVESEELDEI